MIKVKLTKIRSNHNNLRTDEILGETLALPTVGESFRLVGESLTPGGIARVVTTTPVKSVEELKGVYQFHTENSLYKLEVLPAV